MRLRVSTICLAAAGIGAVGGFAFNSFDLLFSAAVAGSTGLALRVVPLRARAWRSALTRGDGQNELLEHRLRVAEEQLDSVTRELTDIREKQDFDRQLTDGTRPSG